MILQIANFKANVSTNDIFRARQCNTCQSQLLGIGVAETEIKSKSTLHKHKYKCMILLENLSAVLRQLLPYHRPSLIYYK